MVVQLERKMVELLVGYLVAQRVELLADLRAASSAARLDNN